MSGFGKRLSEDASKWARHAMEAATNTMQVANIAIASRLQTCDNKNNDSENTEIKVPVSAINGIGVENGKNPKLIERLNPVFVARKEDGMLTNMEDISVVPKPKIWGSFNFPFCFNFKSHSDSSPSSYGQHSNGSLVALGKFDREGEAEIPLRCSWYRRIGTRCIEVPGVNGNIYHMTADDVSCYVIVEATPLSKSYSQYSGTAFGEMGPFEIDPATRKCLDSFLASDVARFPVRLISVQESVDTVIHKDDFVLQASSKGVNLFRPDIDNLGKKDEWSCLFCSDYPTVELRLNSATEFNVILGPTPRTVLRVNALSRSQRDQIVLAVRCLQSKKFVTNSALIDNVFSRTDHRGSSFSDVNSYGGKVDISLDFYVIIQRLLMELYKCLDNKERIEKEKQRAVTEKAVLEKDLTETLVAYQKIVTDGNDFAVKKAKGKDKDLAIAESLSSGSQQLSSDLKHRFELAQMENRLRETESKNEKYLDEIELLKRDLQLSRTWRSNESEDMDSFSFVPPKRNAKDTFQVSKLEQKIYELSKEKSESLEREKSLKSHVNQLMKELETLQSSHQSIDSSTADATSALNDKIEAEKELQRQLLIKEEEKEELQNNFLYIKTKFDDLSSSTTSAIEQKTQTINKHLQDLQKEKEQRKELERNFFKTKTVLDGVLVDNNRLTKKCASLAKELEKCRTENESAKQRLGELKQQQLDQAKEVEESRISVESMQNQLKSITSTMTLDATELSFGLESLDIGTLMTQFKEKESLIRKFEAENESLRSRVRKLAQINN